MELSQQIKIWALTVLQGVTMLNRRFFSDVEAADWAELAEAASDILEREPARKTKWKEMMRRFGAG